MAVEEEDDAIGIPEWVVTFGDMMSLLLTFFIMLVSLSEIKEEEKYQALVSSMRRQFGYTTSSLSVIPGDARPRNSPIAKPANAGRAKQQDTMQGGDKVKSPVGENPRVRIIRPGQATAVGTVIQFGEQGAELSDENKRDLELQVAEMRGKPQKIEVRGHTSLRRVSIDSDFADNWELAYQRCRNAMRYLVDDLGIDSRRIRISVAGPNEPVHIGTNPAKLQGNPRVEVFLLDETASDLTGTPEEQEKKYIAGNEV